MEKMENHSLRQAWKEFRASEALEGLPLQRDHEEGIDVFIDREINGGRSTAARIEIQLPKRRYERILDVGCSAGTKLIALVEKYGPMEANGIDPHGKAIAAATSLAIDKGLFERCRFETGYAEHLPYPNDFFDLIICHTVLEHVNDPSKSINELIRVLRPGGILHLECPNYRWPYEGHLGIWCLPILGKGSVAVMARLQGRGDGVHYLDHLQFVTAPSIIRSLKEHPGLEIENLALAKLDSVSKGTFGDVVFYRRLSALFQIFNRLGVGRLIYRILAYAHCYPSVALLVKKP